MPRPVKCRKAIMAMLPYAEARNNARNWTLKISGRVRQMRIAR